MLVCLGEGAGQGAEVGAGARLPMGLAYVCVCCWGRTSGHAEVGAGARLPVERVDV